MTNHNMQIWGEAFFSFFFSSYKATLKWRKTRRKKQNRNALAHAIHAHDYMHADIHIITWMVCLRLYKCLSKEKVLSWDLNSDRVEIRFLRVAGREF